MEKTFKGVAMTELADRYKITLATSQEKSVSCFFGKQMFEPIVPPEYCRGNDTKNRFLLEHPDRKEECTNYILWKELGDTLQVLWLKYIIDSSLRIESVPLTQQNAVITTADNTVLYRAVLNGVPVIHRSKEGHRYYHTSEFNRNSTYCTWLPETLFRQNQQVIANLQAVIQSEPYRGTYWINGVDWKSKERIAEVKQFLATIVQQLITQLPPISTQLTKILSTQYAGKKDENVKHQATLLTAIYDDYCYNDIFSKRDTYYKTNDDVKILMSGILYDARLFTPDTYKQSLRQVTKGGFSRTKKRNEKQEMVTIGSPIFLPLEGDPDFVRQEEVYFNANPSSPHFLYLYTVYFHDEAFTYAAAVRSVAVFDAKRYPDKHDKQLMKQFVNVCQGTCAFDLGSKYYDIGFWLGQQGQIKAYPEDIRKFDPQQTFQETLFALFLTSEFIKLYPALRSKTLCAFISVANQRYAEELKQYAKFQVPEFEAIIDTAMGHYAAYYQLSSHAALHNRTVSEAEFLADLAERWDKNDESFANIEKLQPISDEEAAANIVEMFKILNDKFDAEIKQLSRPLRYKNTRKNVNRKGTRNTRRRVRSPRLFSRVTEQTPNTEKLQ